MKGVIAALWEMTSNEIKPSTVFLLRSNIVDLKYQVKTLKDKGKKVYVDMDFVEGLGEGEFAINYIKLCGADGVITIKLKNYLQARKLGIPAILRFFALDSRAVEKGINQILINDVDTVEILPGIVAPKIVSKLPKKSMTIIAAGLIETIEEAKNLLKYVDAISTSSQALWNLVV